MWTLFARVGLAAYSDIPYEYIIVEEDAEESKDYFLDRWGTVPGHEQFLRTVTSSEDLAQLTAFDRGCAYDPMSKRYLEQDSQNPLADYHTLEAFLAREDVLVLTVDDMLGDGPISLGV